MLKNEQLQGWWELAKGSDMPFWPRVVHDLILSYIEALAEVDRINHIRDAELSLSPYRGHSVDCVKCSQLSAQWVAAKRKEILGE